MDSQTARWKPDADEISVFIRELAAEKWLGQERRRWPYQLFHLSDVRNAARIIATGRLLSRTQAIDCGELAFDSASRSHIKVTDQWVHDYVRLYFRPRNKTFKVNEGFLPQARIKLEGAHCPMPVAFVFDSETVLAQAGTRFSDGNLARSRKHVGADVEFLRSLPFKWIYRDPSFDHSDTLDRFESEHRDAVDDYRQAEVLVPHYLSLDESLFYVCVRSEAERETLITLLDQQRAGLGRTFEHEIQVDVAGNHFLHRSVYVAGVSRERSSIRVEFNRRARYMGPFQAGSTYFHAVPDDSLHGDGCAIYLLKLDDHVAYIGAV